MSSHVLKAFFYIDAVKADKIRRKSYEKTIVIGNSIIVFVATMLKFTWGNPSRIPAG